MMEMICLFSAMMRADVNMNPFVMIWAVIGSRSIAIALVGAVVVVTAILIWLLKRKNKGE